MAATPKDDQPLVAIVALMANLFERLGLNADKAAAAFHTYASFTIGSTLFAATRRITMEAAEAEDSAGAPAQRPRSNGTPTADGITPSGASSNGIHHALDEMMDLSITDPVRDEELFVEGLRRLIAGFAPADRQ
jgi:hypothetical protein